MNDNQKRKFTRINLHRKVNLQFQGKGYGPCRIKDLSLGGMYVLGNFAMNAGEFCSVAIPQCGTPSDLTFKAIARVRRKDDIGVAIEFTSMGFNSYMYLQTTLLYEAEDPVSISIEFPKDSHCELTESCPDIPEQNKVIQ